MESVKFSVTVHRTGHTHTYTHTVVLEVPMHVCVGLQGSAALSQSNPHFAAEIKGQLVVLLSQS